MRKLSLFGFLLLFLSSAAFSQDKDSVEFVGAKWTTQKIAPKTKLISHHFTGNLLFGANENISFVEVKSPGRGVYLALTGDEKTLITTSDFAKQNNAIAAINGTFFDVKNGGSVDFVKINGKVINTTRLEKNNKRARHQQAAIIIDNGTMKIQKWDGSDNWEQNIPSDNVMLTGPLLILNSTNEKVDSADFNKLRHPRTAIGIKPDGRVILLTVDGRNTNSAGMSMFELTKVMRWLGCTSAINLDGGGSTTLWATRKTRAGVINFPTDNKLWDHKGERKVANAILLKKR